MATFASNTMGLSDLPKHARAKKRHVSSPPGHPRFGAGAIPKGKLNDFQARR
jgi:hypothetical protein